MQSRSLFGNIGETAIGAATCSRHRAPRLVGPLTVAVLAASALSSVSAVQATPIDLL